MFRQDKLECMPNNSEYGLAIAHRVEHSIMLVSGTCDQILDLAEYTYTVLNNALL